MVLPDAGTALLAGIVVFYLVDCVVLSYADEVIFVRAGRRWVGRLADGAVWAGRSLSLPAWFSPGSPVLRVSWQAGAGAGDGATAPSMQQLLKVVAPLRWHAWLLALALFVGVPVAVLGYRGPLLLWTLLAVLYLPTAAAMGYLYRQRRVLGLSASQVAGIGFEVLACPPFALNLVRRVTLRVGPSREAARVAVQLLDNAQALRLSQAITARQAQLAAMAQATGDGNDRGAT